MYPNSQEPQYSVDYLNQIASPTQQSKMPKHFGLIAIILGIMVLLTVAIFIFGTLTATEETTPIDVAVRLETLETVTRDSQENLSSGDLRSINSNLTLALTNSTRELEGFLGADAKAVTKLAKDNPQGAELNKTLEDANLNAVMNRTYPREMAYELEVTLLMIEELEKGNISKSFADYLAKTRADLEPLYEQLKAFNQD